MSDLEPLKLQVGEKVVFEDFVVTRHETQFGVNCMVKFADSDGQVFRKCWEQGGMLEFLNANPQAKSIVLKKKLKDGELTHNKWALE